MRYWKFFFRAMVIPRQAWKKCRSRNLGSDKTADFGIKLEFKKKMGEKRRRKRRKKGERERERQIERERARARERERERAAPSLD